ncbi:putative Rho-type GTPase-activating protein 2 [Termitomyces sp. J132]|nr:putative Rho-type GTPase-activating protein 2 [Termitomyces sp. J132]
MSGVALAPHSSSSSTTPTSSASPTAVTKDRPLTSAYLLKVNANAEDPKLAALEQAVNDRNVLSSQNAQLWKLIEKQRAGYNQILKELERIRSERDGLKVKLSGLGGNGQDKRHRGTDVDRSSKRSFSENAGVSSPSNDETKQPTSRQYPEEQSTPRSVNNPQLHFSRSHEPLALRDDLLYPSANPVHSLEVRSQTLPPPPLSAPSTLNIHSTNSTPNIRSSKPYPTSLVVSPRYETPSVPGSTISAAQSANTGTSDVTHGASSTSMFYTSSSQQHYNGGVTPQTVSAASGDPSLDAYQTSSMQPQPQSQISATPLPPSTAAQAISASLSNEMLPRSRPEMLSRDSRISLPDEARQYIANMTDSPVPSPRVDAFVGEEGNASQLPQPQIQVSHNSDPLASQVSVVLAEADHPGGSSEFLDMNGDDDEQDVKADHETETDDEESAAPEADEDMDATSLPLETPKQTTPVVPRQADRPQFQTQGKLKPRIAVDLIPPPGDSQVNLYTAHVHAEVVQQQRGESVTTVYGGADHINPLENPYSPSTQNPQPQMSLQSLCPDLQSQPQPMVHSIPANFRALPLLPTDLPHTIITVSHSFVRPNDRGKEVLSFVVFVDPGNGKEGWKVEKMYSDVLGLDQRVRAAVGKGLGKKIVSLPEGKLWKDHAPAKVDQRKAVLENYLQTLIRLPARAHDEVIAFFTSDIVRERKQPVMQVGHKEGYLTKRGKNFGGWKTRYFVLQGPVLEYYDCRGGAHLGSIQIAGAQIGRQQRSERVPNTDEEKEYRHAFLIVEAKKGPGGSHTRHVLCAESDNDRDAWVEILVRYFTGTYSEEPMKYGPPSSYQNSVTSVGQPRSSTSSSIESPTTRRPTRGLLERGQGLPSSLPDSSPLSSVSNLNSDPSIGTTQRANSELGHYPELNTRSHRQASPERHRARDPHDKHKSFHPILNTVSSSPTNSSPVEGGTSPEKLEASKVKISGPLNGAVIPSGFKFGKEYSSSTDNAAADRRVKSRSFWGFGKPNGDKGNASVSYVPRVVFGVPLDESLEVAQIANLPAIVFRSIQYLEAKKAEQEEGIYRLSGSSAVIKNLKDRFNMEGDVDLLASDEYWDPHAIAGLLKSFLRELPASILTRDLHLRFLAVIDFVNPQERIKELSQLIAALPLANYSLLRALTAHLILIVQNSSVNKMTMRNVGIVFSPTLGIPAGVFSLMLGEFNRVFNVDIGTDDDGNDEDDEGEGASLDRRNSKHYLDTAADQLLGLTGRTLKAPVPEAASDNDEASAQEESGAETTDNELTVDSSSEYGHDGAICVMPPDTPTSSKTKKSKAANVAATRGLNVSITGAERGNRHSKMLCIPASPRPAQTLLLSPDVSPSPSR